MKRDKLEKVGILVLFIIIIFAGLYVKTKQENIVTNNSISYEIYDIPEYNENIYVVINNNIPNFSEEDMEIEKDYSSITPSGFKQQKYDTSIVSGEYLYHRCHLITRKLGGIDVDKRNVMAGTRDFNVKGMKQFEDKVYNYLKQNQTNHVIYRVTPYFEGDNKLANGVNIEAYSVEDNGKLHFNVYVYNVQDGIVIDYATGESKLAK